MGFRRAENAGANDDRGVVASNSICFRGRSPIRDGNEPVSACRSTTCCLGAHQLAHAATGTTHLSPYSAQHLQMKIGNIPFEYNTKGAADLCIQKSTPT